MNTCYTKKTGFVCLAQRNTGTCTRGFQKPAVGASTFQPSADEAESPQGAPPQRTRAPPPQH